MSVCRLVEDVSVCAGSAAPGAPDAPAEQQRSQARLAMIIKNTTTVASAVDRSTWVDAREALPRD